MTMTATMNGVRIGSTRADDVESAVAELASQIAQPDPELVLYFSSTRYDPDALAAAMERRFPGVAAGCSTAGEIGPDGYARDSVVAMCLGKGPVRVSAMPLETISSLDPQATAVCRRTFEAGRTVPLEDCFGMILADGLSLREESVVASLYQQFQPMTIVGGSAGDDHHFRQTQVFHGGRALRNGAVFLVFEMGGVPFQPFRLQDFAPISDYMVITGADPERRQVHEIDGEPAVDLYARLIGFSADRLTPELFASHSLLVQIGGEEYVRSVRSIDAGGNLSLHSAIDEGVVIRLGRSDDTLVSLAAYLAEGSPRIARTSLAICFDCMHRRIELARQGRLADASRILNRVPSIGFSTYGEIVDSLHVNQTMTGVLIGWRDRAQERR